MSTFKRFLGRLQTPETSSLIEAISKGYSVIYEGLDSNDKKFIQLYYQGDIEGIKSMVDNGYIASDLDVLLNCIRTGKSDLFKYLYNAFPDLASREMGQRGDLAFMDYALEFDNDDVIQFLISTRGDGLVSESITNFGLSGTSDSSKKRFNAKVRNGMKYIDGHDLSRYVMYLISKISGAVGTHGSDDTDNDELLILLANGVKFPTDDHGLPFPGDHKGLHDSLSNPFIKKVVQKYYNPMDYK